ncbi:MAG: cyclically-permuted mutarotase family protein [Muribaculaceae bacterium]|nr:cyclically-permuted mutarotase family protein [Muribaculaceae bacterium]
MRKIIIIFFINLFLSAIITVVFAKELENATMGGIDGLKVPEIYSDHMVLQRYRPIKITGRANAGDTVFVILGKNKSKGVSDYRGNWTVTLPTLPEQVGLNLTITDGKDTIRFKDIAVGEVWLASGQSNMEFQMRNTSSWDEDKDKTGDSLLRLFNMRPVAITNANEWSEEKKSLVDSLKYFKYTQWKLSNPETAKYFSAIGWYYGKFLRDSLNVPIGIISNAIGGSPAESWIDSETLELNIPEILVDWRTNDYLQPWVQQRIGENTGEANDTVSHKHPYDPSYLFSSGILPLNRFPIAGTIWYQGESNAHNVVLHEKLFQSLLESWRKYWQQPEMPFLFVQLSSIDRPTWPWFRDSQRRLAERNKNVWMAVSSDLGDSLDVHPKNKKPIGERLARQALNHIYSMNQITPQGPTPIRAYQSYQDEITIEFDYAEGLKTSDGNIPYIFEIAGPEGIFKMAENVVIENDKIIIKGMETENPQLVRYGWQPFTRANLINGEGLPASTFKISIEPLKDINDNSIEVGFESGLSGSFTGVIDGELIIAGGCNFPNNPMAPESVKKFYKGIYKLSEMDKDNWTAEIIGNLPFPMAYGSTVSLPNGLLIIGGSNAEKSFSEVFLITKNEKDEIEILNYPSLPGAIDNSYATFLEDKIFIAGGNFNGLPSNNVFTLDLNHIDKGWQELKSFPGNPRVQPVLEAATNQKGEKYLYLWSGFAGKGENRDATLNTDGLRYDLEKHKWKSIASPKDINGKELSLAGGAITTLPDGKMVAIGGVNKDIFLEALKNQAPDYLSHNIEWYKFNPNILVFNPAEESWIISNITSETARAGAGIVSTDENEIIVVGGELKPRIRTSEIYKQKID